MLLGFRGGGLHPVERRPRRRSLSRGGRSPPQRIHALSGERSWTELAVEKVAGLLALATGVGLLAPLVFALQRDEADGVGAAVIAVLSGITLVAGVMLLLGSPGDADERRRGD